MSIRQQVDDAAFLAQHGRYLGALTHLLLAVAASSRLALPKKTTPSREQPGKEMGDGEAFVLFLGGRIRQLMAGNFSVPEFGTSGIQVAFRGKNYDIAYVLYKFYRCELIHDGDLPKDVQFNSQHQPNLGYPAIGVSTADDKLALDYGWLGLLEAAVVQARCNGKEFGIQHRDLVYSGQEPEADFEAMLIAKYHASPGRIDILKRGLFRIALESVNDKSDADLIESFRGVVDAGHINGGAIAGLRSHDLSDDAGNLRPNGLGALRELASVYRVVDA